MIRIIVAGTTGSGKAAVAHLIFKMLEKIGAQVTVIDAGDLGMADGIKAYPTNIAKEITKDKKSEVVISTQQLIRELSPNQIEKAWMAVTVENPAARHPQEDQQPFTRPSSQ